MPLSVAGYTERDHDFLRKMLAAAAYWRESAIPLDLETALSRPDLTELLANWGHPDDHAIVAELNGTRVGAAWYRTCVRSYGFVAEAIPELGIGVEPDMRSRGAGTLLLRQLIASARDAGFHRLSLSVEMDNPARRLYQRLGFDDYTCTENAATMIIDL